MGLQRKISAVNYLDNEVSNKHYTGYNGMPFFWCAKFIWLDLVFQFSSDEVMLLSFEIKSQYIKIIHFIYDYEKVQIDETKSMSVTSVARHISETSQAIAFKFDKVTASVTPRINF